MGQEDTNRPLTDGEEPVELLIRQVKNKVDLEGKGTEAGASVPLMKLFTFASPAEKLKIYLGWFFAAAVGTTLPAFFFFIGDVFDSFTPDFESTKSLEQQADEAREKVNDLCIKMGILTAGLIVFSILQNYLLLSTQAAIASRLKSQYLKAVLNQESAWFDQTNYMELASRMNVEVQTIATGVGQKFGSILYACFMSLFGFIFAFVKGWSLALVLLTFAPVVFVGMGFFTSVMQNNQKSALIAYGQSGGYAEQALNAIRIVVSFGQEQLEIKNYNKFLEQVRILGQKQGLTLGISLGFFFFCIYLDYAFSFCMGAVWVEEGYWNHAEDRTYTGGDTMACFFGVLIGLFALGGSGPGIMALGMAKGAGKSAFDVIDREPKIKQDDASAKKHPIVGEIEFRNATFVYPSRPDQKILDNFNMTFKTGETTAIVGPSGSGKSTIIQLVERFYDPEEGQVLIDGQDLKSINLRNYRQQIGYVGQEPVLFNTTVRENLLMGKPDATEDEIMEALKAANAYDFIMQDQNGIDAQVGAGGGQLSGGQKQRLALARAFIKKPRMLIFDEATSALDKTNEAEVQRAIDGIKEQMRKQGLQVTTLVIAHRLSTIEKSDRIIVLKKGKLVQDGTHAELAAQEGTVYHKMVQEHMKSQAKEQASLAEDPVNATIQKEIDAQPLDDSKLKKQKSLKKKEEFADKDPEARQKYTEAEKMRKDARRAIKEGPQAELLDPKKQDAYIGKQLDKHVAPAWKVIMGMLMAVIVGAVSTMFGWMITEVMFSQNEAPLLGKSALEECSIWLIIMVAQSFALLFSKSFSGIWLSNVTQNLIMGIREELYENVMRKDIGWHDMRDNSASIMTSTLASDVQLLNGMSAEGKAIGIEAMAAMLTSIIAGAIFSWPMTLVGVGITPLILIFGAIAQKADNEAMMGQEDKTTDEDVTDEQKESQILASDSIANFKTVASFGNDKILLDRFHQINMSQAAQENKSAVCKGIVLGLSVGITNGVFPIFYWASAELNAAYPTYGPCEAKNLYIAMFLIIFGAFTASTSISMGPDAAKAKRSAIKIFSIITNPSKVDVLADDLKSKKSVSAETFQGKIEFKDVWFRYPARLHQWIFKGLNLTIDAKEAVAIVGESGQGKSTFIGLVMRFYDPEFGQVLIDGVDIREYNVVELRQRLGLVMQEPLLFNYTIRENVLYGDRTASNAAILEACQAANCREFIESDELSKAFDDDPSALKEHMIGEEYKQKAIQKMGQQDYDEAIRVLDVLIKKAEDTGKFAAVKDLVDERTDAQKGEALHAGYDIMAGQKGSKLSGGQKQRVAISRAIVRQPGILLLDEATSALDETSQRLVNDSLKTIMRDRTSIVVAHRLTTVQDCSRLAVIEGGKIVETDTFDNLVNSGGTFAKLAKGMRKAEKKEKKEDE